MRILVLVVLFGVVFLACLGTVDVIDYDEACYAEVSREMYVSGNLLEPQLNGKPFYEKPPLLYWVQVLGYGLFGISAFGARIINALAGMLTLLMAYLFARRPLGERAAFFSSLILGSSILFAFLSRVALTDMLLLLAFLLCLCCFFKAVEDAARGTSRGTAWFLAACLFSGIAMLAKGAVGVLFPAGTLFLYLLAVKRLRIILRPVWAVSGAFIIVLVGTSWYFLLGFTHPDGFLFVQELFIKHHVGRFISPMQGHYGSLLYYIPVLFFGFLPWSVFFPWSLKRAGLFRPKDERTRFLCLFGIFGAFTLVFFSLAATKLPNYISTAFPAMAFMTATLFAEKEQCKLRGAKWAVPVAATAFLLAVFAAGLIILPSFIPRLPSLLGEDARKAPGLLYPLAMGIKPYVAGFILAAGAVALIVAWRKNHLGKLVWALTGSALGTIIISFFLVMPVYNGHFVAPLNRLAVEAGKLTPENGRIVLVQLTYRPSVIFYSGKNTEFCGFDKPDELRKLLILEDIEVGLTTEYYLSQLQETGLDLKVIRKDTGYVLFSAGE